MTMTLSTPTDRAVTAAPAIEIDRVSAYYGGTCALADVSLAVPARAVTAFIGPSGCGKTTLLRTLNRMHEVVPGARVDGCVRLAGVDLYQRRVDPVDVRRLVGMVFQRPNPFPTMSVAGNVLAGVRLNGGRLRRSEAAAIVERALTQANLWEEVKDRLHRPGGGLSGGQQQRLCIARAIAVEPQVLLMDEPCSALDPVSTAAIEDLIVDLKRRYTVVMVTHNMQQAARVSDTTAFFNVSGAGQPGRLVEAGASASLFSEPRHPETASYVAGRFG